MYPDAYLLYCCIAYASLLYPDAYSIAYAMYLT